MLGVFAEFETNLRRERQMEGITKAKAEGKYKGRKATVPIDEVRRMRAEGRGCVLIVRDRKLEGIFTERDILLKIAGSPIDLEATPISVYMTPDPETLPADASVAFALHKMVVEGFRHIPLLDEIGGPSVVSMRDLMEYLCEFLTRDVLNIPPRPNKGFRSREGG